MRMASGRLLAAASGRHGAAAQASTSDKANDPVCGMTVDPQTSPHHTEHVGTTYHFCSAGCLAKFVADPGKYLSPKPAEPAAALPGSMYICPMHPQIRQDHPGTCPICGMALESEMPGLDDEENPELRDFSRRFWWTLPLTLVVLVLSMLGHQFDWLPTDVRTWIELVLTTPVVLWAGWPFLQRCVQSIRNRSPNM